MLGAGGSGKTRLAAELCRRAQTDGALAGFLEADAAPAALAALGEVSAPLLVVVDEASARLDDIARLLIKLAAATSDTPLRVVLLARRAGEWWDRVLPERLGGDPDAEFAYSTSTVLELGTVDDSVAARERAFRAAAAAFAARMSRQVDELPLPDLTQQLFEQILFVHLAALSALEGDREVVEGRVVTGDLLRSALKRESRYWADTAAAGDLELKLVPRERAVALATLTVADSEDDAASALTAVPELANASQERLRDVARWLRDLYPPPTGPPASDHAEPPWFRPLTPVLLGEALVAQVLETAPELPTRLLDHASAAQAKRALTALTHAARAQTRTGSSGQPGSAEQSLRRALRDHLSAQWIVALEAAQETGDPLGRLLALTLEQTPQPELAARIEAALPKQSVTLRELAAAATQQTLEHARQHAPSLERDSEIARLANNQSNRLSDLGRREEALAANMEAVDVYRRLAEQRPDAFLPKLAGSLNNQAGRLGALGRREEALAAIEEAVDVHRRLAEQRPDAFLPDLAMSLNNQSLALGALGRREEAVAANMEAVAVYRRLAEQRPDAFLPDLAASLNNQSLALGELGRREEALAANMEAVDVYRRLAEQRPDAFLPKLAGSLNNQSLALGALGRREEARAAIEEAVDVHRRLAEQRPDAFLPDLAMSLNNQSVALGALGRREEALAAIEEAVAVYRRLAEQRPDAFLPNLAGSLDNQSNRLGALGRREEEALAANMEAVAVYRRLAEARPDAFLPDLAGSLDNQSNRLGALGRREEEALAANMEAVAVYRRLAEARPDAFLPDLAGSLNNQSLALGALGRREEALAAIEEAVQLVLPLLERAPYVLPDSGLRLAQDYLQLCQQLEREPEEELVQRIHAVLVSAGVLSADA